MTGIVLVEIDYVGLDVPELGISTFPLLWMMSLGQRLPGLETNLNTRKIRKQRMRNLSLLITQMKLRNLIKL